MLKLLILFQLWHGGKSLVDIKIKRAVKETLITLEHKKIIRNNKDKFGVLKK